MTTGAGCRVRVPATTANLGPGFDCLGMALDLWNDVRFSLEGDGVRVTMAGEYGESLPTDETNLVARSFLRLYEEAGAAPPAGLTIDCDVRVPPSSGLGSSAAAAVAGLLGANTLLGRPFDRAGVLELAAAIDGHPDNVAATLLGGLTIVVRKEERLLTKKILVPEAHVAVPFVELHTTPQPLQLFGLESVSTSQPLSRFPSQLAKPVLHVMAQ